MKVSIAMATFNGEAHLWAQCLSLLEQAQTPDEVVIVDDCSSDGTWEILQKFERVAPFTVHLRRNASRGGHVQAFAHALRICTGDVAFLCDQDDVWLPGKVEAVCAELRRLPSVQVVLHDLDFCDENLRPIGQSKIARISSYADPEEAYMTGAAMAVRRAFLDCALPIPIIAGIGHDEWLAQCAYHLGVKALIRTSLARYRRHANAATRGAPLNSARRTTRRDFTKGAFRSSSRPKILGRMVLWSAIREWLVVSAGRLERAEIATKVVCLEAAERLDRSEKWAQKRLSILSVERHRRVWPVLEMLTAGGYRQFSGIRSALKDVLGN